MPRKKRGYRKFFTRPAKNCRTYGSKHPKSGTTSVTSEDFLGFDVSPLPDQGSELRELVVPLIDCVVTHAHLCTNITPAKNAIRVLSVFDGISTGLYSLNELGIKVEAYYSSEIEEKALRLQRYRFNGSITVLGCVTQLTRDKIESLGRIDLLLGGPPCEDLSLVNPARRGLHDPSSTGRLFFKFKEVLQILKEVAERNNTPFYWLMENTSHMEKANREEITMHLSTEPVVLCASHFSPMRRRRLYWGNIPDMHVAPPETNCRLQSLLGPCRDANVVCLPTLTSTFHSELSGTERRLPVQEDGQDTALFITERELAFGFREHFTDGPNLSLSDRRKLLGKAWSVPVIKHLLRPLCQLFAAAQN